MVQFVEDVPSKEDVLFVHEDPARIYRGLRDLLVDEFDMDRIDEGHMEFNVEKPKDRVRMRAYKEKSPYTELMFKISFKAKRPRDIYTSERDDDILKARFKVSAKVVSHFPAGESISWLPAGPSEFPERRTERHGLRQEELSSWHRSKIYEVFVKIWYRYLYSKEVKRYTEEAEEIQVRLNNLLRQKFGVERRVSKTGKSQYRPPWRE